MTSINYILIAVGFLAIWLAITYNALVKMRMRTREALSDIDVQLKRRFDLIPNLIESVKGYVEHESSVLENVTKARAEVAKGGDPLERAGAENALTDTLKTLFAVAENYPDLKASANFLDLQRELSDTENKIQASRRFFNTTTKDLNTKIQSFPANMVAKMLGFKEMEFFKTEEDEKEPVKVSF
jgi:LemA protein